MQHGSWLPGFNVETVPPPLSAKPPDLQELQPQGLVVQQPPGAFKGDPLIGHVGGSPVRCTAQPQSQQQQQQQQTADSQLQQQQQKQQLYVQSSNELGSPAGSPPVAVSCAASIDSCGREVTPQGTVDAVSPLSLSPLSRGRQPLRQSPLLASSISCRSPSPPLNRRSSPNSASPTRWASPSCRAASWSLGVFLCSLLCPCSWLSRPVLCAAVSLLSVCTQKPRL